MAKGYICNQGELVGGYPVGNSNALPCLVSCSESLQIQLTAGVPSTWGPWGRDDHLWLSPPYQGLNQLERKPSWNGHPETRPLLLKLSMYWFHWEKIMINHFGQLMNDEISLLHYSLKLRHVFIVLNSFLWNENKQILPFNLVVWKLAPHIIC